MLFSLLSFLLIPLQLWAQAPAATENLQPIITGPQDIEVGKIAVFDADTSKGITNDTVVRWYLNDARAPISQSLQAAFTPLESGETTIRLVLQQEVDGEVVEREISRVITAYNRKIVLVAGPNVPRSKLQSHYDFAKQEGVFLRITAPDAFITAGTTTEELQSYLLENSQAFLGSQAVVVWSEGSEAMQALLNAAQSESSLLESLEQKPIILITERGLNTIARSVRGAYAGLNVEQIIVTRKEALLPLVTTPAIDDFLFQIEQNDIGFEVVDASSVRVLPWNLLSSLVNYMLANGVSNQTILLLLTLPIIATLLAFFKQVIGISTMGVYTPSVIALGFISLGLKFGVPVILFIVTTGYITRALMRNWRLLYIPKVAITITVVSFTLLVLLGIGAVFNFTLDGDKIFILLIMSTLSESFFNLKLESGLKGAVLSVGETIGAALVCAFIVQLPTIESFIVAYPELILLTLIVNIFLGQWTGLRLIEYFRFKDVFDHIQE